VPEEVEQDGLAAGLHAAKRGLHIRRDLRGQDAGQG
jgi:predicted transcriptional regulator